MIQYNFSGRGAIVTGAGTGIGFEIARKLTAAGAAVLLNDIDEETANRATQRIVAETGGRCLPVVGDSSDIAFIRSTVEYAVSRFGRLDYVVANAGITTFGKFLDYPPEAFNRLVSVNLQGTFFLAQAAARQMRDQGFGGRLVFMSSVTGHQGHPDLAAYGMTKAGIEMLARALALELGQYGVTINAIAPGATLTERTALELPDYAGTWGKMVPTGKASTPEDIANTALFLLSPGASQITGQTLVVDGGWTTTSPTPDRWEPKF